MFQAKATQARVSSEVHLEGKRLVFLIGAPRSGTTWLQLLLSQSNAVCTTKETHLFSAYLGPWQKRYDFERNREYDDIGLFPLLSEDEMLATYCEFAEKVIQRVIDTSSGGRVVLEKTPNHALCGELILRVFPDATFIHVVRDPRAVAASLVAAGRSWGSDWAPRGCIDATKLWVEYVSAARDIAAITPNFLQVSYESLRTDGRSVLKNLFDFIGVDESAERCAEFDQNCSLEKLRDNESTPSGFFRRGEIDSWRRELSHSAIRTIEYVAGGLLADCGYKPDYPNSRRIPLRVRWRTLMSKIETAARMAQDAL